MFGYVTVLRPELRIKDDECYRSYYCGLCRTLRERGGLAGQSSLSYDMTFLALLLSGLFEPENTEKEIFCLLHPGTKHRCVHNRFLDYAADMNLLLSYYDRLDDWQDEKKLGAKLGADALKKRLSALKAVYPRQSEAVENYVRELAACEKEDREGLDTAAGLTGRMLGEIFVPEEMVWSPYLRSMGFWLGKFIYLMDAYEDMEKDREKHAYNPWLQCGGDRQTLSEKAKSTLTMMMGECSLAFEHLPILRHEEILRNILYAGVWNRFEELQKADREKARKEGKNV